jgi:hypothetical protein
MIMIEVSESGYGTEVDLTVQQAASLAASRIVSVAPIEAGRWIVGGTGKVGVAQIGDITLRVAPSCRSGGSSTYSDSAGGSSGGTISFRMTRQRIWCTPLPTPSPVRPTERWVAG